jgi:hypothetical protein
LVSFIYFLRIPVPRVSIETREGTKLRWLFDAKRGCDVDNTVFNERLVHVRLETKKKPQQISPTDKPEKKFRQRKKVSYRDLKTTKKGKKFHVKKKLKSDQFGI